MLWLVDLRLALRRARRESAATLVLCGSLAACLSLGAMAAGLIAAVYQAALPYERPAELAFLWASETQEVRKGIAPPDFEVVREAPSIAESAAFMTAGVVQLSGMDHDSATIVQTEPALFHLLRVKPAAGRILSETDFGQKVAFISYGMWQERFGGGLPLGSLSVEESTYSIVGVAPQGFIFPDADVNVWTPLDRDAIGRIPRGTPYIHGVVRLREGRTSSQLNRELQLICSRLAAEFPATNRDLKIRAFGLRDIAFANLRQTSFALFFGALLVFLLGGLTLGQHLVSSTIARMGEIQIRTRLGASSGSLHRGLIVEGLLILLPAMLLALLLTPSLVSLLQQSSLIDIPGVLNTQPNFVVFLSVAIGAVVGIVVAALFSAAVVRRSLRLPSGGANVLAAFVPARMQYVMIVSLAAISAGLATGAIMMGYTFNLRAGTDWGFNADNTLLVDTRVPRSMRFNLPAQQTFSTNVMRSLSDLPGIEAYGMGHSVPIRWGVWGGARAAARGSTISDRVSVGVFECGPGYFRALGAQIRAGREFDSRDGAAAEHVVIVNELLARRFWPDGDAVGHYLDIFQFRMQDGKIAPDIGPRLAARDSTLKDDPTVWQLAAGTSWRVIGVAPNIRMFGFDLEPEPAIYISYLQVFPPHYFFPGTSPKFLVRPMKDWPVSSVVSAVKEGIRGVDRDSVIEIVRLQDLVNRSIAGRTNSRLLVLLFAVFSFLSLCLSIALGHSLAKRITHARMHDAAIRIALGADVRHVLVRHVLGLTVFALGGACAGGIGWMLAAGIGMKSEGTTAASWGLAAISVLAVTLSVCGAAAHASTALLRCSPSSVLKDY